MKILQFAVLALAVSLLLPSISTAGLGMYLTIVNKTGKDITIIPDYANCWYDNDLGQITVQKADTEKVYYTESKHSGSCAFKPYRSESKSMSFFIQTSLRKIPMKVYFQKIPPNKYGHHAIIERDNQVIKSSSSPDSGVFYHETHRLRFEIN